MDLFNTNQAKKNILPFDGEAHYYGVIFPAPKIRDLLQTLLHKIEWQQDEVKIYGKTIITKRKVAWYAQKAFTYKYSHIEKTALPFTELLIELKEIVEKRTHETFNACLLNLYHNGSESMGWHSDDEKEIVANSAIASLSFGATRTFAFKHKKNKTRIPIILENGSLLVMKGETQKCWLHNLPKTTKVNTPRINLTFRKMIEKD